jgi:hypothetical protein
MVPALSPAAGGTAGARCVNEVQLDRTYAIRQQHMHMLGAAQLARMLSMGAAGLAEYKLVDLQSRPGPSCRVGA